MIPVPVNNFIHNLQLLFLQDQVHSKLEPHVVGPSMYCFFYGKKNDETFKFHDSFLRASAQECFSHL